MKKTIVIIASLGILSVSGAYANTNLKGDTDSVKVSLVNDNISSLCKAAMQGDVEKVRSLIATGESVNEKSLGMTPAMFAARYNKAEVLQMLIDHGANLKIRSNQGFSVKKYAELSNATDALAVLEAASGS